MIAGAIDAVLNLYVALIFIWVLMSWLPLRGTLYDAYRVLGSVVEPYVGFFRRLLPSLSGLDFSPWVAILVLQFVVRPLLFRLLGILNVG